MSTKFGQSGATIAQRWFMDDVPDNDGWIRNGRNYIRDRGMRRVYLLIDSSNSNHLFRSSSNSSPVAFVLARIAFSPNPRKRSRPWLHHLRTPLCTAKVARTTSGRRIICPRTKQTAVYTSTSTGDSTRWWKDRTARIGWFRCEHHRRHCSNTRTPIRPFSSNPYAWWRNYSAMFTGNEILIWKHKMFFFRKALKKTFAIRFHTANQTKNPGMGSHIFGIQPQSERNRFCTYFYPKKSI